MHITLGIYGSIVLFNHVRYVNMAMQVEELKEEI